jgi:hypothetical protein
VVAKNDSAAFSDVADLDQRLTGAGRRAGGVAQSQAAWRIRVNEQSTHALDPACRVPADQRPMS